MNQNVAAQSGAGTPVTGPAQQSLAEPTAAHPAVLEPQGTRPTVPDHELLSQIGRGSYGDVWLAKNAVGTLRAVKIVHRQSFDRDEHFEREFRGLQKFEPLSRTHDGFVDVLQLGRNDQAGYFYYVMELADGAEMTNDEIRNPKEVPNPNVKGTDAREAMRASDFGFPSSFDIRHPDLYTPRTLRHDLKHRCRLSLADCLQIGRALADALAHLHGQGLVHRDIKPSNIIFVNGAPKLADIGLVTSIDDAHSLVGTVGYIPPEGPGSPQADIYSLGKVLYEAAFGKDRQEFPQLPADLQSYPDHAGLLELNEVITKACDADARQRYQPAEEMRVDLELLRHGQSVKQKRVRQRAWALCKKASIAAGLVVLAAIVLLRFFRGGVDDYAQSRDPEVNVLVDQGDHCLWGRAPDRVQTALVCYKKAIDLDPKFVPAWWGLHSVYVYQGGMNHDAPADVRRELRSVARKLMEIDPHCAESLVTSAELKWIDWQFREALAAGHLATQLRARCKSGRTWAHGAYGFYLQGTGDPDAALRQYQIAEKISAPDSIIQDHIGQAYFEKRDFEQALKYYQKSLDMEPRQGGAHYFMAKVHEERGDFMAAIQEFEQSDQAASRDDAKAKLFYEDLRDAVRQGRANGYWKKRLDTALREPQKNLYYIATFYARLEDKDNAYAWLRKACEQRAFDQYLLMFDLCWDHTDAQFQAIARKFGLMQ